jgi:hypothetical protein
MTEADSQTFGYTRVCDQCADPIKVEDFDEHEDRVEGEWCVVFGGVVRGGSVRCVLDLGDVRGLRNRACRVSRYAIGICVGKSAETVRRETF